MTIVFCFTPDGKQSAARVIWEVSYVGENGLHSCIAMKKLH